jgi:hypothetical protein
VAETVEHAPADLTVTASTILVGMGALKKESN